MGLFGRATWTSVWVALALFGCSGRDGVPGATGPTGAAGPPGASGGPGPGAVDGRIAGLVQDGTTPVSGVRLEVAPGALTSTTGSDGRFTLGPLAIGLYRVTASRDGYVTAFAEGVSVRSGAVTELAFQLAPVTTGVVRGTVRFATGEPAARITIGVDRHGGRTITDERGAFTLTLPATTYALTATPLDESYRTAVANDVKVPRGGEVTVELRLAPAPLGQRQFVGSSACIECHASQFARWTGTAHATSVRPVDDPVPALGGSIIAPWAGTLTLARAPGVNYQVELTREGEAWRATLVDAAGARRTFDVARTHGGGRGWKQRYQVKLGTLYYALPIQWNEATRGFVAYKPEYWFNAAGAGITPTAGVSYEQNCIGCHSTGLRVAHDAGGVVTSVSYAEGNIGCEACHGPGSRHVQTRSAADIVNPRRLITRTEGVFSESGVLLDDAAYAGFLRANEACGQCHARGVSNAAPDFQSATAPGSAEYPYAHARGEDGAYQVGEPLDWFLLDRAGRWTDTLYDRVRSSKQHHQQWSDTVEARAHGGVHAQNARRLVACFDCHSPHGSALPAQLRQTAVDNTLCLSCHADRGPLTRAPGESVEAAALRHSAHFRYTPSAEGQARCIGCHMPRTAKSGAVYDIASHTMRPIAPHESRAMRDRGEAPIPNSCNSCHPTDSDEGARRYELLFGPPTPVAP